MKPVLIFSGANDRAVIAFCRYAESVNINYSIVANGDDDLIFLTDYKKNIIATRIKNVLNIDIIIQYANKLKPIFLSEEVFILPSTEYLNRLLLSNEKKLLSHKISFGLCEDKLYNKISNKYDFGVLCSSYNINLPKEFYSKPKKYPYVIKPKTYFNSSQTVNIKPAIISNKEEDIYIFSNNNDNDLYYQEYVAGKSIYLLFYFYKNGCYSVYSQENFIQQHNGGSMILSKSANYHLNKELVSGFATLFINEGFNGLVMVEVKHYKNKYYMIEANPRLWGPSQLILDANMSLLDDFSIENNLINSDVKTTGEYNLDINYFWAGGFIQTNKKKIEVMIYNYKKEYFMKNYADILKNEIYLRKDTIQIYLKENS